MTTIFLILALVHFCVDFYFNMATWFDYPGEFDPIVLVMPTAEAVLIIMDLAPLSNRIL